MLKLYDYWRSSAAYRVRIALNLKRLEYESVSVDLAAGEQQRGEYLEINPQGRVPALVHDGRLLYQSLSIIDYLDSVFEQPRLVPSEPGARARVNALAQVVACDMHPLNNSRVLAYLGNEMAVDPRRRQQWYCHWIATGFDALETLLNHDETGKFCHGETPTLADICLVPQIYNARRFACNLDGYPTIRRIESSCLELDAFHRAVPERQPDAS